MALGYLERFEYGTVGTNATNTASLLLEPEKELHVLTAIVRLLAFDAMYQSCSNKRILLCFLLSLLCSHGLQMI